MSKTPPVGVIMGLAILTGAATLVQAPLARGAVTAPATSGDARPGTAAPLVLGGGAPGSAYETDPSGGVEGGRSGMDLDPASARSADLPLDAVTGQAATPLPLSQVAGGGARTAVANGPLGLWDFFNQVRYGGLPEPASWALMLIGFGMIGGALRGFMIANRRLAGLQPDDAEEGEAG